MLKDVNFREGKEANSEEGDNIQNALNSAIGESPAASEDDTNSSEANEQQTVERANARQSPERMNQFKGS